MPRPKLISDEQRVILYRELENNPELLHYTIDSRGPDKVQIDKKWERITQLLNRCSTGNKKTINKWRDYWSDVKYKVKRHITDIQHNPDAKPLKAEEEYIMGLMGIPKPVYLGPKEGEETPTKKIKKEDGDSKTDKSILNLYLKSRRKRSLRSDDKPRKKSKAKNGDDDFSNDSDSVSSSSSTFENAFKQYQANNSAQSNDDHRPTPFESEQIFENLTTTFGGNNVDFVDPLNSNLHHKEENVNQPSTSAPYWLEAMETRRIENEERQTNALERIAQTNSLLAEGLNSLVGEVIRVREEFTRYFRGHEVRGLEVRGLDGHPC